MTRKLQKIFTRNHWKETKIRNKDESPFAYLGLTVDFNDVDFDQSQTHIIMTSCENHIDWML